MKIKKSTKLVFSILAAGMLLGGCGGGDVKVDNPFNSEKDKNNNNDTISEDTSTTDISKIIQPKVIAELETRYAEDLDLSKDGEQLYLTEHYNGIKIINIKDVTKGINVRGSYDPSSSISTVTVSQDKTKILSANDGKVKILDIQNPANITLVGTYDLNMDAKDVAISSDGTKAYIANGDEKFKILDISNPQDINELGSLDLNINSHYNRYDDVYRVMLSKDEKTIYLLEEDVGLVILNVEDTSNPLMLGKFDLGKEEVGIDYRNFSLSEDENTLYLSTQSYGVKILNIQDKTNPLVLGTVNITDKVNDAVVSKDKSLLYVADDKQGLQIYDISNPQISILKHTIDIYNPVNIILSPDGKLAFVAAKYDELKVVALGKYASK